LTQRSESYVHCRFRRSPMRTPGSDHARSPSQHHPLR
jgi:hypothetical protein